MDAVLANYAEALDWLSALGIDLPPNCRLRTYLHRWHQALDDTSGPFLTELDRYVDSLFDYREIDEVTTIRKSFTGDPTPDEFRRLRLLVQGSPHPDDDTTAVAREAQYELFLLMLARQVDPVATMGSVDIQLPTMGFSIEAKRPGSWARFDERLRKGCKQVHRKCPGGFLAISLDEVIRPDGAYLAVPYPRAVFPIVDRLMKAFQQKATAMIRRRTAGRDIAGLWLTLRVPVRQLDTNRITIHTQHLAVPLALPGDPRERTFKKLLDMLESAEA